MQHPSDLNRRPSLEDTLARIPERWRSALMDEATDLVTDLKKIVFLKASAKHPEAGKVQAYRREGYSTYSLQIQSDTGLVDVGTIQFAPLFNGEFLIRKMLLATKQVVTLTEHYAEDGTYLGRYTDPSPNLLYVNLTEMDPGCPVTSHLYNILLYEYQQAENGQAKSGRIRIVEKVIHALEKDPDIGLSVKHRPDDAISKMNAKLAENEIDSALTFTDKVAVRKNLKNERWTIVRVKHRVHGVSRFLTWTKLYRNDLRTRMMGFARRPAEKTLGILHKYTIGVLIWFFSVVRNNIGYSVALAIYAPFTFYFITQPMNPGAMWTVGQVRKSYIAAEEFVLSIPVIQGVKSMVSDLTGSSEPEYVEMKADASASAAAATTAAGTSETTGAYNPATPYSSVKPKFEGMIVSGDVPDVEKQSWDRRMSNFKAMQIAYESNLQFSQRMGRLEQMESQLNFPLIAESSYREIETYQTRLAGVKAAAEKRGLNRPEVTKYLEEEAKRAKQFKLYIWDRMVRYMLDHPYIVMNEAKEQVFVDYYIGRNFIFLEEITMDLMKEYEGLKKPEGFKSIDSLAKLYRSKKVEGSSVEERLSKNSYVHKQKGFFDSNEMRANLKRQWEILFLSQNRAQEASNFGLQLYVWSVRNAIWAIGALTTAKNREMELIRDALENSSDQARVKGLIADGKNRIEPLYESLFHILSLEYVSIREELNKKLDQDIESTQRQTLIEAIGMSFEQRTAFLRAMNLY